MPGEGVVGEGPGEGVDGGGDVGVREGAYGGGAGVVRCAHPAILATDRPGGKHFCLSPQRTGPPGVHAARSTVRAVRANARSRALHGRKARLRA
ncbi:hypothetical protein GCM10010417_09710 [Streptomyces carpaticus]